MARQFVAQERVNRWLVSRLRSPKPPCTHCRVPTVVRPQDPRTQGSLLYSYVQTDDFCDAQELSRTVTTSLYEPENLLVGGVGERKGRSGVRECHRLVPEDSHLCRETCRTGGCEACV